jgi:hypothetical protein
LSSHDPLPRRTLVCMVLRMQVEIRDEDIEPLRTLAWNDHRQVREHAGYLLHLKIQEEIAKLPDNPEVAEVA